MSEAPQTIHCICGPVLLQSGPLTPESAQAAVNGLPADWSGYYLLVTGPDLLETRRTLWREDRLPIRVVGGRTAANLPPGTWGIAQETEADTMRVLGHSHDPNP